MDMHVLSTLTGLTSVLCQSPLLRKYGIAVDTRKINTPTENRLEVQVTGQDGKPYVLVMKLKRI